MSRLLRCAIFVAAGVGLPAHAQQAPPAGAFDAVSIKRNQAGAPTSFSWPTGAFVMRNGTALILVLQAYTTVPSARIEGLPAWAQARGDGYDVTARGNGAIPDNHRAAMMRALLADRFKLKVRTQTRTVEGYALVAVRPERGLGPGARPAPVDCLARAQAERAGAAVAPLPPAGSDGITPCLTQWNRGELRSGWMSMPNLATSLAAMTGRTVVDRTGVTGSFAVSLSHAEGNPGDARPSVFTALQEQLGLKLEPTSTATEFLVIEHIERPTED